MPDTDKQSDQLVPFAVRFAEQITQKRFSEGSYGDETTADTTGGKWEDPHSDT